MISPLQVSKPRYSFVCLLVLLAIGAQPASSGAQQAVQISGYLEHQFSATHYSDAGWQQIDYDRLRVDLHARAGRGARASAAVVYQLFRGNTAIPLRDILPEALATIVDTLTARLETQHFLNHAYMTIRPGKLEITAGKQYLTWGAAAVFNPTELFRPKNLLEPGYEREGVGALSAKYPLGRLSDIRIAWVANGGFDSSGKLLRVRHHISGFDLSALVADTHEPIPSATILGIGPQERRRTVGGDISGEILGLGIWTEAAFSDFNGERWTEITVGGNYTLSDDTRLLLEGYYDGRGSWDGPYTVADWLSRVTGTRRTLGKAIAIANVNRPFGQLWTLGLSAVSNVGDQSTVLIPSVAYSFAENVDLLFNGLVYVGADGTEFGTGNYGGFLRGRVYF